MREKTFLGACIRFRVGFVGLNVVVAGPREAAEGEEGRKGSTVCRGRRLGFVRGFEKGIVESRAQL